VGTEVNEHEGLSRTPTGVRGKLAGAAAGIAGMATAGIGIVILRDSGGFAALAIVALGAGAVSFAAAILRGSPPFPMALIGAGVGFIGGGLGFVGVAVLYLSLGDATEAVVDIGFGVGATGFGALFVRAGVVALRAARARSVPDAAASDGQQRSPSA
jgi:hypothetical protein